MRIKLDCPTCGMATHSGAIGWDGEVNIITSDEDVNNDEEVNSDTVYDWTTDNIGISTMVEGKLNAASHATSHKCSQLVSTVVISSFTEMAMCQGQNPMVPVVMLNGLGYNIALYDCVKDFLLISQRIELIAADGKLDMSAVLCLFLFTTGKYWLKC